MLVGAAGWFRHVSEQRLDEGSVLGEVVATVKTNDPIANGRVTYRSPTDPWPRFTGYVVTALGRT